LIAYDLQIKQWNGDMDIEKQKELVEQLEQDKKKKEASLREIADRLMEMGKALEQERGLRNQLMGKPHDFRRWE
jgi:uncharacterized protein YaaR (DUF327 family)